MDLKDVYSIIQNRRLQDETLKKEDNYRYYVYRWLYDTLNNLAEFTKSVEEKDAPESKKINELIYYAMSCETPKVKIRNVEASNRITDEKLKALFALFTFADDNDIKYITQYFSTKAYGWFNNKYIFRNTCFSSSDHHCKMIKMVDEHEEIEKRLKDLFDLFFDSKTEYSRYILLVLCYCIASLMVTVFQQNSLKSPRYLQIVCNRESALYNIIVSTVKICDINSGNLSNCSSSPMRICNSGDTIFFPTSSFEKDIDNLISNYKDSPIIIDGFDNATNYTTLLRAVANVRSDKKSFGLNERFRTLPLFVCPSIKSSFSNVLTIDLTDIDISKDYYDLFIDNIDLFSAVVFDMITSFEIYAHNISNNAALPPSSRCLSDAVNNKAKIVYRDHNTIDRDNSYDVGLYTTFFEFFLDSYKKSFSASEEEKVISCRKGTKVIPYTWNKYKAILLNKVDNSLVHIYSQNLPKRFINDTNSKKTLKLAKRIEREFQKLKVNIQLTSIESDDDNERYRFRVDTLGTTKDNDVYKVVSTVKHRLAEFELFHIDTERSNYLALSVAHKALSNNSLRTLLANGSDAIEKMKLPCAIGFTEMGEHRIDDMYEFNHLLIGGATNSGKTNVLRCLLLSLYNKHRTGDVNLIIIDLLSGSGSDSFGMFNGHEILACPVITDPQKALIVFKELYKEYDRRRAAPEDERKKYPHIVCVVDEFPKLFSYLDDNDKTISKETERNITSFISEARHANIRFVFATQNPTKENMKIDMSNFTSRIALKCSNAAHYTRTLGLTSDELHGLKEMITGVGQMIVKITSSKNKNLDFIYGAYVSDKEIADMLKEFNSSYVQKNLYPFKIPKNILESDTFTFSTGRVSEKEDNLKKSIMWALERNDLAITKLRDYLSISYKRVTSIVEQMEKWYIVEKKAGKTGWSVIPDSLDTLDDTVKIYLYEHDVNDNELQEAFDKKADKNSKTR